MDLQLPFPKDCRCFPEKHVRGRRRKRSLSDAEVSQDLTHEQNRSCCTLCLRYNSMIFIDFIDDDELVVVEQPWLNVVATFPDALQRKIYGT